MLLFSDDGSVVSNSDFSGDSLHFDIPEYYPRNTTVFRRRCVTWQNSEWDADSCTTTQVAFSEAIRCNCDGSSDFAVIDFPASTVDTSAQQTTTSVSAGDSSSGPWLGLDMIFLIFVIIVALLVLGIVFYLAKRNSALPPETIANPEAPPVVVTEQDKRDLQDEFSEASDIREFEYGGDETSLESDNEQRDFSIRLEEMQDHMDEDQTDDAVEFSRRDNAHYNVNASTLPPPRKVNPNSIPQNSTSIAQMPKGQSGPKNSAVYNYQPPSTKISATTPLSTASLLRSLSSARKLTQ